MRVVVMIQMMKAALVVTGNYGVGGGGEDGVIDKLCDTG